MELLTIALMVWAFAYAVENAKSQWRHTRDQHARGISRQHPTWHPRKVRRHAQWRAVAWWAHEARDGFPSIRRGWAEDREHVRFLREQELISQEARLGEWRAALADMRARRAAHAAAVERGETTASFGQWYRQTMQAGGQAPVQTGSSSRARSAETGTLAGGAQDGDGAVGTGHAPLYAIRGEGNNQPAGQVSTAETADGGHPGTEADPVVGEQRVDSSHAAEQQAALSTTNSGVQQAVGGGDREAPAAGRAPADLPPGACGCGMPACRSGWPVTATARREGSAAPTGSGLPAGEPDRNGSNGGKQMTTGTVPNGELTGDSPYRSALTAMDGYDQVAAQHEQAAETLEAQLTLHGFDRDQGLMEHIRALRETAGQIRAHTAGARQVLVDHHATGDEYHTSGVDAEASAFRH